VGEQITFSTSEAVQETTAGTLLRYFSQEAFVAVQRAGGTAIQRADLFAQLARFNTLYMVARAGSGHLGSSFSSLDMMSWLYLEHLSAGDRFFSSKGHDSPGLYAVHTALNILPFDKIHALRRLDGLPGHPDVGTPGAYTNTGSLGMGVAKAKGFLFADNLIGRPAARVYVLTGDGELQEGQFWESLMSARRDVGGRLTVIVDHNKIQSDTFVVSVSDLGDLASKLKAFDFEVHRCNGNDIAAFAACLNAGVGSNRPQAIIADTEKGCGVSFMEHTAMSPNEEYYRFHSGAPSPADYARAASELLADIAVKCKKFALPVPAPVEVRVEPLRAPFNAERMIPAYTQALLEAAERHDNLVALDADLVLDTGLISFKDKYPKRFIECGIAEQDMVSRAGTMALAGALPLVHSFACFLTSRASEQIYNNSTERSKIIYVGSLAGLLPGGPGHSHQAVRDITAMSAMPGVKIIEPASAGQVKAAVQWAVDRNHTSTYLRLTSIPYPVFPEQAGLGPLVEGQGHVLREGSDVSIVAAGPVMTYQALAAAMLLDGEGMSLQVISMPWINVFDTSWFAAKLGNQPLLTLESHYVENGFGTMFVSHLATAGVLGGRKLAIDGVTEIPACGRNDEVLEKHGLSAPHLVAKIRAFVRK
jgi:transketolase